MLNGVHSHKWPFGRLPHQRPIFSGEPSIPMNTKCFRKNGKNCQQAFTLKELLAVLFVLGLFATVALAAMGGARDRSVIAQCESNLRQFGMAVMIYGGENNDKLPSTSAGGSWAWDLPWAMGNLLNSYGAPWQIMYCPGTAFRFSPSDNFILYTNYSPGVSHIIDYAVTFGGNSLNSSNVNSSISPQSMLFGPGLFPPSIPSKRVLLADATLNTAANGLGPWDSIQGGYAKRHTSAHLLGPLPAGGNVAFLDGHVEWRPFSQMVLRTSSGALGAYFFW
jgi:prepilin-type N-terminal cleavage/methylation domain-containing protein/prepilin-type processing-associated H-X9-DG protein